jgi:hypothetical protein
MKHEMELLRDDVLRDFRVFLDEKVSVIQKLHEREIRFCLWINARDKKRSRSGTKSHLISIFGAEENRERKHEKEDEQSHEDADAAAY